MALTTALCAAFISTAHAIGLNIKTMIPERFRRSMRNPTSDRLQLRQVLAEQNADERRDPASLTKMMTSYVIGQAMKAGKFKERNRHGYRRANDAQATGNPVFKKVLADVPQTGNAGTGLSPVDTRHQSTIGNDACVAMADF